jgi:hypothetical protein
MLRSIRPTRATTSLAASVDPTDARCAKLQGVVRVPPPACRAGPNAAPHVLARIPDPELLLDHPGVEVIGERLILRAVADGARTELDRLHRADERGQSSGDSPSRTSVRAAVHRTPSSARRRKRNCSEGRSRPVGWGSGPAATWGQDHARIAAPWAVRQLLIALSPAEVDQRSLLPDVWIAAHREHSLQHRRDEVEATASARRRRRARLLALQSPLSHGLPSIL